MSTTEQEGPFGPVIEREEEYELLLLVRVTGYGTSEHQAKQASEVKRILEVNMGGEVKVATTSFGDMTPEEVGISWNVERLDRNAKQVRGEA